MDVALAMRDLLGTLEPPKALVFAVTTLGLTLGGLLIAIGERERGVGYLVVAALGGILAWNARALLSLVGL